MNRAFQIATFLEKKRIHEVAVILENGMALFEFYFACMLSNIMIVPVDPQKSKMEIEDILSNHEGIYAINNEDFLKKISRMEIKGKEVVERIGGIDLDKVFMTTYTSGSTGRAKGVRHSLGNLFRSAIIFGETVGFSKRSVVCHTMPMTYMAGILNTIIMPFIMESRIVIFPRFDVMSAISFWKNVEKYQVNTFWLSPTMLNVLLTIDRRGEIKKYFEEKKPLFCIGTAPLFPKLKRQFEERYSVKLLPSYGLSETLFLSSQLITDTDEESVGTLFPGVDIVFGEDSEIKVFVPWMYLGYNNETTDAYFEGGRYCTGDLGYLDNGKLHINGRKKDLIIKGGMNISPKQIEETLLETGLIRECAVSSYLEKNEEKIVCWYVPVEEKAEIEHVLNDFVIERLGRTCMVDKYIFIDRIPKNLNGKTDKAELRRQLENDIKI